MVLGTRQMLQKLPVKEVSLASARDLGLQVDFILRFDERITNIVSSCLGRLCQVLKESETSSRHQDTRECYKCAGI